MTTHSDWNQERASEEMAELFNQANKIISNRITKCRMPALLDRTSPALTNPKRLTQTNRKD